MGRERRSRAKHGDSCCHCLTLDASVASFRFEEEERRREEERKREKQYESEIICFVFGFRGPRRPLCGIYRSRSKGLLRGDVHQGVGRPTGSSPRGRRRRAPTVTSLEARGNISPTQRKMRVSRPPQTPGSSQ